MSMRGAKEERVMRDQQMKATDLAKTVDLEKRKLQIRGQWDFTRKAGGQRGGILETAK